MGMNFSLHCFENLSCKDPKCCCEKSFCGGSGGAGCCCCCCCQTKRPREAIDNKENLLMVMDKHVAAPSYLVLSEHGQANGSLLMCEDENDDLMIVDAHNPCIFLPQDLIDDKEKELDEVRTSHIINKPVRNVFEKHMRVYLKYWFQQTMNGMHICNTVTRCNAAGPFYRLVRTFPITTAESAVIGVLCVLTPVIGFDAGPFRVMQPSADDSNRPRSPSAVRSMDSTHDDNQPSDTTTDTHHNLVSTDWTLPSHPAVHKMTI